MRHKIAGATINTTPLDWQGNRNAVVEAIQEARNRKVELVCFPELCLSGYGCEDWFLSSWVPEAAMESLHQLLPHTHDLTVAVGLPVAFREKIYNGVAVIDHGQLLGITCKQFLANDGVHYEPRWFTPWPAGEVQLLPGTNVPLGDLIYTCRGITFGFEICEDGWRKSDRPGYRLLDRHVDLILNPSASHFAMGKSLLRESEVVIEGSRIFQCAYLFVNLTGNEAGRMIYDGDIVAAQRGTLIGRARRFNFTRYHLLDFEIDFQSVDRSIPVPDNDTKDQNEEVSLALALALFDYLRKSKSRGFVVSLSGGADSSMTATLVAEMIRRGTSELGLAAFAQQVGFPGHSLKELQATLLTCAYQATDNSSSATRDSAQQLAASLGATFHEWSIQPLVEAQREQIETAIGFQLNWTDHDIALQNIQARTRSPLIWMLANLKRAVLLTTSNRSEGDVGYATMDGDTSGSLAPIAGLSKPFILQWLKWAEQTRGYAGLAAVNALTPTAELRPAAYQQTDETDLMPYSLLEAIERQAILLKKSPREVYQTLILERAVDPEYLKKCVVRFFKLWSANQWKRERLAPSFHLDEWNVDPRTWCRFPILSSGFESELAELTSGS